MIEMTDRRIRFKLPSMNNGISPFAANERALIIVGADGFIGSEINRYFRDTGWKVQAAVYKCRPRPGEIRLDVNDPADFNQLLPGIPVINAAGLPDQGSSASMMRKVHVGGMRNLLAWAEETSCPHIIQLSSIAVYGNATVGTGRTEASTRRRTWNPITASLPYGRTKARAEAILEKSGLPWSAPRLPAVYGPGDSFFTGQIRRIVEDSRRPLPPGGGKTVSILPVDVVGPLLESIVVHGPLNAALNASGAAVSWKEILEVYAEAWNLQLTWDTRRRIVDFLNFSDPGRQMAAYYSAFGAEFPDGRLRSALKWNPDADWKETVKRAADALSSQSLEAEVIPS